MKNPKISIVTPSYNCGKYIEQAILSVINQDYDNFEYFVIDGGSKDNTINILKKYSKKYPQKIKWISEPDKGQTDAINKGLRMCSGGWFIWLNADDFYEPNIFFKLSKAFKKYPNAGIMYGNCYNIKQKQKVALNIPKKNIGFNFLRKGCCIYGPASFFNMGAIKKLGEFDESLEYWMDYEMYLRIAKVMKLQYVNLNVANFRIRPNQKSKDNKNRKELHKEMYSVIKKYNPLWRYYMIFIIKSTKRFLKDLK